NFLFNSLHATPVVPLPKKGSKTIESIFDEAVIILLSKYKGFCVGCLPYDFSDFFVNEPDHTSFICLLLFTFFISSLLKYCFAFFKSFFALITVSVDYVNFLNPQLGGGFVFCYFIFFHILN